MSYSEDTYDYLFKIIIIGDSGVGKSNLLLRYTSNEFLQDSRSTIGVEFATKTINIDNHVIKAQLWDTSGQERYKAITSAFYRGAVGALLVYDITRKSSFNHIAQWLEELNEHIEDSIPLVLVGNKIDLSDTSRAVSTEEAKNYASKSKMMFFEASAYDTTNVTLAFETMFNQIYKELSKSKLLKRNTSRDVHALPVNTVNTIRLRPPSVYNNNNSLTHGKKSENKCCS
ncbi:Putative Rab family, other [Rhizopus microsporus]|uniref:Small GTPase rab11-3 n=2 Tax=Rhizopus microsporus TaxID=58291 RepID=A0A2G4SZG6_RHIZD|nr:small GTPase rab11-3 [Rhizopus microsporus ATCC 52813]PHZ14144.1 small GTPase rab11-3 [Rhizopus microsporus ATCC 52813]CEG80007.1 Putative Rab family, other [Rhizopus microsporus]